MAGVWVGFDIEQQACLHCQ